MYKNRSSRKSIIRDYFQENRTSQRPFLLLRIGFPGRPIFIQLPRSRGQCRAQRPQLRLHPSHHADRRRASKETGQILIPLIYIRKAHLEGR